jgi:DNA-binding CsgD family transcriptional regulator
LTGRSFCEARSQKGRTADRTLLQLLSEEETTERIATLMGISVKTVYTKKHKVHCRLKAQFASTTA